MANEKKQVQVWIFVPQGPSPSQAKQHLVFDCDSVTLKREATIDQIDHWLGLNNTTAHPRQFFADGLSQEMALAILEGDMVAARALADRLLNEL